MIRLTDEQVLAVTAPERLVNIVSAPGSGKTTVASERFGYQRHRIGDGRALVGLSFTRAAVSELSTRITRRWGSACLGFPHRVLTFDALHCLLLERLLDAGLLTWPGGHKRLDVRDTYRGFPGYRWLTAGNYRRAATLSSEGHVVTVGAPVTVPGSGIGRKDKHDPLLEAGVVSHEDVRAVLLEALKVPETRESVSHWLSKTFRGLVIDEVYDAAVLDLSVALIAAEAGLQVTLIGDPRQALYGWRGARPDLVGKLLAGTTDPFAEYQQSTSFRFQGPQMPGLARALRAGAPVSLPAVSSTDVDVALARRWSALWVGGDNVLPLAFRNINNATDAALNLLLDVATRASLGRPAYGREVAVTQLRLDSVAEGERDAALYPILARLRRGESTAIVLEGLRDAISGLGVRRPNRLGAKAEALRQDELISLRKRLQASGLVPGLTVHQAKGGEWTRVGVVLTAHERGLIAAGLRELEDDDCVVYVALTRAKELCGLLAGDLILDSDSEDGGAGAGRQK